MSNNSDKLRAELTSPCVSVIVPNYNHAPYLRERIDSILNQTFQDFELILLDDYSTDNSQNILRLYASNRHVSHICINQQNSGSTFAQWKKGLSLAKGKYVWIAESDDFAHPEFLETTVAALENNPKAVFAFTGSNMADADSNIIPDMDWDRWSGKEPVVEFYNQENLLKRKLLWTADIYNASMVLFRRNDAPEISPLQLKMRYCGDWLFWVNLSCRGGGVEIRRKLNNFRQHNLKVSPNASKSGLYFLEGLPIMVKVADILSLNAKQRLMLAGRTLKRLRKFPNIINNHWEEVSGNLELLSPGASTRNNRGILWYEFDKFFNFTGLQHRK